MYRCGMSGTLCGFVRICYFGLWKRHSHGDCVVLILVVVVGGSASCELLAADCKHVHDRFSWLHDNKWDRTWKLVDAQRGPFYHSVECSCEWELTTKLARGNIRVIEQQEKGKGVEGNHVRASDELNLQSNYRERQYVDTLNRLFSAGCCKLQMNVRKLFSRVCLNPV
ncbi:hypothetical protein KQX54_001604 [Cotesia glomerata]|uniref:Uncharacterized protein n=1 Tax=Cotesia glomerata TaxID=32391 RepID=A0AAV7IK25_COTGL|nr:hypothetical protein KQX54_001604 [Cotesia glomerata]